MTNTIHSAQQKLELGQFVVLFTVDVTSLGGPVLYWTPSRKDIDHPIIWQGHEYTSVDAQVSGFDKNTSGTLPRPQIILGNADNVVSALLIQYRGLKGIPVTRTKTLYEFLDDQPGADPTACWPVDIFRVERKIAQNKQQVTLELAAATDQVGAQLPGRPALREICTHIYRHYNPATATFNYTKATCPYTGTVYFDEQGVGCAISLDACGKRLTDCKLRFGANPLPTRAFPALAKTRIR